MIAYWKATLYSLLSRSLCLQLLIIQTASSGRSLGSSCFRCSGLNFLWTLATHRNVFRAETSQRDAQVADFSVHIATKRPRGIRVQGF